jgi:hypothetical protein
MSWRDARRNLPVPAVDRVLSVNRRMDNPNRGPKTSSFPPGTRWTQSQYYNKPFIMRYLHHSFARIFLLSDALRRHPTDSNPSRIILSTA